MRLIAIEEKKQSQKLVTNWLQIVSHCGLAIHIKKYLKAKEEL